MISSGLNLALADDLKHARRASGIDDSNCVDLSVGLNSVFQVRHGSLCLPNIIESKNGHFIQSLCVYKTNIFAM